MPFLIIAGLIAAALILRRINEAPELNLAGHEYAPRTGDVDEAELGSDDPRPWTVLHGAGG